MRSRFLSLSATRFLLLSLLVVSGCGTSPYSKDYVEQQPKLDLFSFFNGEVKAWGIVQNRKGQVTQRFIVDIAGAVDKTGQELTLDETFEYMQGDGVKKRVWKISRNDVNRTDGESFVGEASDIVDSATGDVYGNTLNWTYQMDLTVNSGTYRVTFDDWMWALDDQTIVNRAYIKKFGLVMAEVTLFMQRQ